MIEEQTKTDADASPSRRTFDVSGMTCSSCAMRVEKVLGRHDAVERAAVNFASGQAVVELNDDVDSGELIRSVEKIGYGLEPHVHHHEPEAPIALTRRLVISAALTVPLVLIHFIPWIRRSLGAEAAAWIGIALATPVQFWAGWPFLKSAALKALRFQTNMDTLVAVGTLAAYGFSLWALLMGHHHSVYFETAAVIITLILLGKFFEARALRRTSAAVRKLLEMGAKEATVLREGVETQLPVDRLVPGDLILVRPGEKIPVDGVIREGASSIDQSMITGESMPREVAAGEEVFGASINGNGRLVIEATRLGAESALAQIVRLVEEAQGSKAPVQRLADRVAGVFVPVVIALAALTFALWFGRTGSFEESLIPAIAVLIIACPCGMGLATPTAIMAGTGRGAEIGVLIRGGEVLERSGRIQIAVLDKTGTVTEGKMVVTNIVDGSAAGEEEVLALAATVEGSSEHPIGRAIAREASRRELKAAALETFEASSGFGVWGTVDGKSVAVGSPSFLSQRGASSSSELVETAAALKAENKTVVQVAWDGEVKGLIALADRPRPGAREAIAEMKALGLEVILLTGDNESAARRIADEVGVDDVIAGVLPEGKLDEIKRLQAQGKIVAMVGDGVNDAPALAQADLGIAIGSGTDVAIEASDITLVGGDPAAIPRAIRLARRTLRTIYQNLFWAFVYNVAAIPLAALGNLNPSVAAAAMAFSSVSVVGNALRLRRF
jgi:Cu+-exporting ATPase